MARRSRPKIQARSAVVAPLRKWGVCSETALVLQATPNTLLRYVALVTRRRDYFK